MAAFAEQGKNGDRAKRRDFWKKLGVQDVARRGAGKPFADRLFDCCWVELHGYARPQLVVQKRMRPAIFAIDAFLYEESGRPLPVNPDAPVVLAIYNTTISPRRMVG